MKVSVSFDPRDLWLGLFWIHRPRREGLRIYVDLHVYVCLLPMLPLLFVFPEAPRE